MVRATPVVAGYEDLRLLGEGGFARVFAARQIAVRHDVALKVIDGADLDERTLRHFDRETAAAVSLRWHPHVVTLYDAGLTDDGVPFLAMELLPGGSLADQIAAGRGLDAHDATARVGEVAGAVAAAHEAGLLHRDVKPANILLDRLGRAQLADFGISRLAGTRSTVVGAVIGTPAYIAPEVLVGGDPSPASDVFALGATLAALLIGENPYARGDEVGHRVIVSRIIAGMPIELPPATPPAVEALVRVCTGPVEGRPTALQLEEMARRALANSGSTVEGSAPPPPSPEPRTEVPSRREGDLPPPESAWVVRPDHTLAEPPAPPELDPVDLPATRGAPAPTESVPAEPSGLGDLEPHPARLKILGLVVLQMVAIELMVPRPSLVKGDYGVWILDSDTMLATGLLTLVVAAAAAAAAGSAYLFRGRLGFVGVRQASAVAVLGSSLGLIRSVLLMSGAVTAGYAHHSFGHQKGLTISSPAASAPSPAVLSLAALAAVATVAVGLWLLRWREPAIRFGLAAGVVVALHGVAMVAGKELWSWPVDLITGIGLGEDGWGSSVAPYAVLIRLALGGAALWAAAAVFRPLRPAADE